MTSETEALNAEEDDYADSLYCAQCPLPRQITLYEQGFQLLQQQLVELREDLKNMAARIDTLDGKRTVRKTNG